MLKFSRLSLRRGPRELFHDLDLTLHAGQKVGVVGANGCGKSSLFSLILGELHADSGEFTQPANLTMAHVAQATPSGTSPAIEYVQDGDEELRTLQKEIEKTEQEDNGIRLAELHGRMEAIDGYRARARAARLMHGLGFKAGEEELPLDHFSGGWRMRLNLARALMCRSDLLLLDEPTNHLDLDAVIWLEEWLSHYPGTLLLISHDRDFLDRVAHHILHIEGKRVNSYAGNYSDFEIRRAEQLAQQQASYEKQQREMQHMRSYVDRFRAKATRARQAQSRLKALAKMELIAPAHIDSPFHFSFPEPEALPHPLLVLENAEVGYDKAPVLKGINLTLMPSSRLGLLGPNGAGKSTLIKLLAGELQLRAGKLTKSKGLKIGYFAQHQLEQLDPDASPLLHLQRLAPDATEQALRDFIGGFGFSGDRATDPVAPFSGGEKARLVLALLVFQRPNLLLLDEPTNHLDLEMRHALTIALQDFQGALIVVSHDRHLLRTVTDELVLIADTALTPYDGDLDDYRKWLEAHRQGEDELPEANVPQEHSAVARKEKRRQEAELRRQLQPLRNTIKKLEREMEQLSTQQEDLESQLAEPALYEAPQKDELKKLLIEKAACDQQLAENEEQWLEANEELEDLLKES